MNVQGVPYRSIVLSDDGWSVEIIDQTLLPQTFTRLRLTNLEQVAGAIRTMQVRGAPLIGATAAYGVALALRADPSDAALATACELLIATRPTAVNLRWAVDRVRRGAAVLRGQERVQAAYREAAALCEEDVACCRAIGEYGLPLIEQAAARHERRRPVNVLTHCNAGWLATVDWGTALAPVYLAHQRGLAVMVWVSETRPRNQGAMLTAWELGNHGVPCRVVVDSACGSLLQAGNIDLCLVGTDRTTADGDVVNKIGTYLKAVAARDCGVPFYVALPSSSIDWQLAARDIPIEERAGVEVSHVSGWTPEGAAAQVRVAPPGMAVSNPGFDVTPARLVTALITERGVCPASRPALAAMFGHG